MRLCWGPSAEPPRPVGRRDTFLPRFHLGNRGTSSWKGTHDLCGSCCLDSVTREDSPLPLQSGGQGHGKRGVMFHRPTERLMQGGPEPLRWSCLPLSSPGPATWPMEPGSLPSWGSRIWGRGSGFALEENLGRPSFRPGWSGAGRWWVVNPATWPLGPLTSSFLSHF